MKYYFSFLLPFKTGIPINVSTNKVSLAREFPLPERRLMGTWEMVRSMGMIKLPFDEEAVTFNDPEQVTVHRGTIDRVEARGVGFSEMQSYWTLPFHDFGNTIFNLNFFSKLQTLFHIV